MSKGKEGPRNSKKTGSGVDAFIRAVEQRAVKNHAQQQSTTHFILQISDDFAFIRLRDLRHPLRFFKQLSGTPPIQFGTGGFRKEIIDDANPARHYTAFVFVGYWLPMALGWLVLIAWEVLGYFRYGLRWSPNDVRCGVIGLKHGRAVRREGATVLAALIESELKN